MSMLDTFCSSLREGASRNLDRTPLREPLTNAGDTSGQSICLDPVCWFLGRGIFMKEVLPKARKLREARKSKQTPKKAATPQNIAEQYFEVLRLRQQLLEAHAWRTTRQ